MRAIIFLPEAEQQYTYWRKYDKKTLVKVDKLIDEIIETPFEGSGKPEALKHNLKGCWSRRINKEHRLVYQVTETKIIIISCKFHY